MARTPVSAGALRSVTTMRGHAEGRRRAQDGADIVRVGDLVEHQDEGVVAAARQDVLERRVFEGRDEDRNSLVDRARRQAPGQVVARDHGGLLAGTRGSDSGGMAFGRLLGDQQALDPAVGIGQGGEHRVMAVKPDRLVTAAGGLVGTGRTGAHGEGFYGATPSAANAHGPIRRRILGQSSPHGIWALT